ncbi:MAG: CehA/McbA family metallohydrolase [Ktedonobacterales bacterium]
MSNEMVTEMTPTTPAMPAAARRFARADLHMHTNLGDGTASPRRVLDEARRRGLGVIAVTDHDHLEGAKRVQEIIDREEIGDIALIWGIEVTTRDGHFLGLFTQQRIKMLTRAEEAIEAIKGQGGLCIIPHPMGRLVPSLSRRKIEELLTRGYPIDGIELYNPSPANAAVRAEVRRLNTQWGFAETGGSDAHFWQHIGAGYTLFPGATADDLRQAILEHTTHDGGQEHSPEKLPVGAYIAQCAWAWFVDPPRKISRMLLNDDQAAPASHTIPTRTNSTRG